MRLRVNDPVWKTAARGGYEGPGIVVATFKNWMGQDRYVVGHRIEGGKGVFYHIYSEKEISRDLGIVEGADRPHPAPHRGPDEPSSDEP